jgi:hypothetical protein
LSCWRRGRGRGTGRGLRPGHDCLLHSCRSRGTCLLPSRLPGNSRGMPALSTDPLR